MIPRMDRGQSQDEWRPHYGEVQCRWATILLPPSVFDLSKGQALKYEERNSKQEQLFRTAIGELPLLIDLAASGPCENANF